MKNKKMHTLNEQNHIFEYHHESDGNKKSTDVRFISRKGWVFVVTFVVVSIAFVVAIVMAS